MAKRPIYDITLDPEYADGKKLGISMIANTKIPAVIIKGVAYSRQEPVKMFFGDNLKYRITAPVMIPGDIYRKDDDGYEYDTRFTAEAIEDLHSELMRDLNNKELFNDSHDEADKLQAYILEAWIVEDPATDKAKTKYNIDVPKGTLMMTQQFTDKSQYQKMVDEEKTGFSIEGYLGMKLKEEFNAKQKFMQEGEKFQIGEKWFIVKDGLPIETDKDGNVLMASEVPAEEEKPEEEVKPEEMAEDTPPEVPAEEAPTDTPPSETYTKTEVDEKIDEVLKIIADVKALIPSAPEGEQEMATDDKKEMTSREKFMEMLKFNKQ